MHWMVLKRVYVTKFVDMFYVTKFAIDNKKSYVEKPAEHLLMYWGFNRKQKIFIENLLIFL